MDFRDSPEEAEFRSSARAWIETRSADIPKIRGRRPATREELPLAKRWQGLKAAEGYACIDWPKELGGGGGTPIQRIIFDQEEAEAGLSFPFYNIGLGICIPTVARFASPEIRERLVPPAIRGEEIWCQLFSEPGAGSDLAAVATQAVREDRKWRINGQKVWTSYAQHCDYGLLLARTDPELPKHRGLTMFWVDMRAPGVEVRPIRQMSGSADFNEVYLTDLVIDDGQRLGDVNDGWNLVRYALMNERFAISSAGQLDHDDVLGLLDRLGREPDPVTLTRLAEWHVKTQGLRFTRYRTMTALSRGDTPGPENSIGKLVAASQLMEMSREALLLMEELGFVDDPGLSPAEGRFQRMMLWAPGYRLGGGSDEILRSIIAERVLGLPADPKPDAGVPFNARNR